VSAKLLHCSNWANGVALPCSDPPTLNKSGASMTSPSVLPKSRGNPGQAQDQSAHWSGVYALSLCSFVLIASEFMPVSLLSPIAETLHLTEGKAGQAISISGLFALITSLLITFLAGSIDRKRLLLVLTAMLVVSAFLVAFAPVYPVLMLGRAILGVAIGGFWSMSVAIAMRLVPAEGVSKALAIVNAGNALASTVAAPLGSLMGGLIGWRATFFCVAPVALIAIGWQWLSLPALPAEPQGEEGHVMALLRRPALVLGLLAVAVFFMGQFALFTYLRPFLEQVTHATLPHLSALLLLVGISGFVGTTLIGRLLGNHLYLVLIGLPAIMALVAWVLSQWGGSLPVTGAMLALWGLAGTAAPVAWWSWLAKTLPYDAEAGGAMMVAVIQLAIALGATVGGMVYDHLGPHFEFAFSGLILALAAALGFAIGRLRSPSPE
jgi:predicted MFS family arabinose efflux permease